MRTLFARSTIRAQRIQVSFVFGLAVASVAVAACSSSPTGDTTETSSEALTMMSISPFVVRTAIGEESGRGPMVVTIRAQGLTKLTASAHVRFGNDQAVMTPKEVAADGTWIDVFVPPLATSGSVIVSQDGRSYTVTPGLNVNQWRNVNGYAFGNSNRLQSLVGGYSISDLAEAFPTSGISPWDPTADAILAIANASLQNGQCFGFSNSSLRFQHGQKSLSGFAAWNGLDVTKTPPPVPKDIWQLEGPGMNGTPGGDPDDPSRVPTELSHFIHISHLHQLSSEFLTAWLANANPSGDKTTFRNQVHDAIGTSAGPAGLITLGGCSHVVQPYWVEDFSTGAFDVYVYDPNLPALAEQNLLGEASAARKLASRIRVSAGGQYTFDDGDGGERCSGGLDQLRAFPASVVPTTPSAATAVSALLAMVHVFGSDAASVTQIVDAEGKTLFNRDGSENRDESTRLANAGVFTPFGGLGHADPIYLLDGHGPYTHTISGKGAGAYTLSFVNKDFTVKLENVATQPGGQDAITVDRAGASVELETVSHAKSVTLRATARGADGSPRTATLSTFSGRHERVRLAFDDARGSVTYTHRGAPTTFTIALASVGADGVTTQFVSAPLPVEAGDVVTFRPSWLHLESGVQMHVKSASGAETLHSLE